MLAGMARARKIWFRRPPARRREILIREDAHTPPAVRSAAPRHDDFSLLTFLENAPSSQFDFPYRT